MITSAWRACGRLQTVCEAVRRAWLPENLSGLGSRMHHQAWSRSSYYGIPGVIDELPAGSVILNASHGLNNYPLFGRGLQNLVVTNYVMVAPDQVTILTDDFIRKWELDYIFYQNNQKWVLGDAVKYQVVYEREVVHASGRYRRVL